jgi:hypothetical protein
MEGTVEPVGSILVDLAEGTGPETDTWSTMVVDPLTLEESPLHFGDRGGFGLLGLDFDLTSFYDLGKESVEVGHPRSHDEGQYEGSSLESPGEHVDPEDQPDPYQPEGLVHLTGEEFQWIVEGNVEATLGPERVVEGEELGHRHSRWDMAL